MKSNHGEHREHGGIFEIVLHLPVIPVSPVVDDIDQNTIDDRPLLSYSVSTCP